MKPKLTFTQSEIQDGDIICFVNKYFAFYLTVNNWSGVRTLIDQGY